MTDTEKALQLQVEQLSLERDLLRKKYLQSQAAYTLLMQQLKALMRHRFGQRSERYQDSDNPQSLLFDNNSPTEDESPTPALQLNPNGQAPRSGSLPLLCEDS